MRELLSSIVMSELPRRKDACDVRTASAAVAGMSAWNAPFVEINAAVCR